jgi:hypothetical protein
MTPQEMEELFRKRFEGTETEQAEAIAFIREPTNWPLLKTAVFIEVAVRWADRMGITFTSDDSELKPEICPHCGQEME